MLIYKRIHKIKTIETNLFKHVSNIMPDFNNKILVHEMVFGHNTYI